MSRSAGDSILNCLRGRDRRRSRDSVLACRLDGQRRPQPCQPMAGAEIWTGGRTAFKTRALLSPIKMGGGRPRGWGSGLRLTLREK